jgi:hypothetical protein
MARERLLKGLEEFGEIAADNMKAVLKRGGKDSSGNLSKSINVKLNPVDDVIDISIEMDYYGQYVDSGRKKGSFPPPPAIKEWIKQKPISLKKISLDSAAYLIGRKIAEQGIKPFPFIEDSIEKSFTEGEDIIMDAMENEVAFTLEEAFKTNPNFK